MLVQDFLSVIGCSYFVGVPDSQLKGVCAYLLNIYGTDGLHHVIAANEGNATAMAAGYHLATGNVPLVYMQNSGVGNAVNPIASLLSPDIYGIPCIFLVGWRGEPGTKDEPQHIFQGKVTLPLLEDLNIPYIILSKEKSVTEFAKDFDKIRHALISGKQIAIVVTKGALVYEGPDKWSNDNPMLREQILEHIVAVAGDDILVSTTGKTSRELFELREAREEGHGHDFLTVGSMGHASSIALAIAQQKPERRIWCLDGDGAALMHMGAMAVIGSQKPKNLIHVVMNNGAHESVGGMPTVMSKIDIVSIAEACGYEKALRVVTEMELKTVLDEIKGMHGLCFLEIKTAIGARSDLGRPTTTPKDDKLHFMTELRRRE